MAPESTVNEKTLRDANVRLCLECGKCTATCLVARYNRSYSPRRLISEALTAGRPPDPQDLAICLTCMACDERCPSGVHFVDLIREWRRATYGYEFAGNCSHGGAFQSLMKLMTAEELQQDRLTWVTEDLKIAERGDVGFFIGCTPYFDAFFTELEVDTLAGVKSTVKILNALGIEPVVSPEERCCGHDLLWGGERDRFETLARKNVALFRELGVKTLLFERASDLAFDGAEGEKVTFQDPCRLARFGGIVEAPRQALAAAGVELAEMVRAGKGALCCAGNGWLNCDRFSKEIQVERLREAGATGATTLVTSCPKCEIHFRCAMHDPNLGEEIKMEIRDLATAVAARLTDKKTDTKKENQTPKPKEE
jgi:Fe-S oxidoreductase